MRCVCACVCVYVQIKYSSTSISLLSYYKVEESVLFTAGCHIFTSGGVFRDRVVFVFLTSPIKIQSANEPSLRPALIKNCITDLLLLFGAARFRENASDSRRFLRETAAVLLFEENQTGAKACGARLMALLSQDPIFLHSFLLSFPASSSFSHQLNSLHRRLVSRTPGACYQRGFSFDICHA